MKTYILTQWQAVITVHRVGCTCKNREREPIDAYVVVAESALQAISDFQRTYADTVARPRGFEVFACT